jgi:drug/metabolite transporter (DMT)-like permease
MEDQMRPAAEPESRNTKLAIIAGLMMVIITAIQFVAARFRLREHLTASDIASLRFVGAGVILLPIIWRTGLAKLKALGWRRASILTLLVGLPYPLIINWGLSYAPAAHAAALCPASIVFFSFVLSRIVFKDGVSNARLVGIAATIVGLLIFVLHSGIEIGNTLFGDLLFSGSGIMFSAYAVLVRRWAVDPVTATAAIVLLFCLLLPFLHIFATSGLNAASAAEIGAQIVIQGFLAGAAAMFLYTYAVRQLGPQIASLFMPCVPVATALTGMIVLGEIPAPAQLLAITIMTAGMILPALQRS